MLRYTFVGWIVLKEKLLAIRKLLRDLIAAPNHEPFGIAPCIGADDCKQRVMVGIGKYFVRKRV